MILLNKSKWLYSFGKFEGPKANTHILKAVEFIEKHLNGFILKYRNEYANITNENGITQKLYFYLDYFIHKEQTSFTLIHQYIENTETGASSKVDLGFYLYGQDKAFFCIEAKRLCFSGKREKEYLIGHFEKSKYKNYGGVERFKKGIHGSSLKYSAIIGYVQKNDFSFWFSNFRES